MKIKVIKAFYDKHSGVLHKVNETIDVEKERIDEINSVNANLIEVISAEEPKAEEPKAEEPKAEEPKAEEPKAEKPKAKRTTKKVAENK